MSKLGRDQVARWQELAERTPDPFCDRSRNLLPNAEAIRVEARDDGLNLRFRCSRGRHHDMAVNAALAMRLFHRVLEAGLEGGWLDEDYALSVRETPQ